MKKAFTLAFSALLASLCGHSQTIFVAPNGTGSGTSWADAKGNLKAAISSASPNTEIWVKEGTYLPTTCSTCSFNDRNQQFEIPNGVRLYGGFAGIETSVSQRNIPAHPTILSGDIDGDGTLANNSFTVVYTQNVNAFTVVDGFTVRAGNADQSTAGLGTPPSSGGGWFNLGSTPGSNSHPTIANCRFEGNHASAYGGAMYNDGSFGGSTNPSFTNCVFSGNTSRLGGAGIYSTGSFQGQASPVLLNCVFENNECTESEGGAMFNIGAENGTANPMLTDCIFSGNIAFHDGGAMYNFGFKGNCSPVAAGCTFDNNSARSGGAIYNDGTFGGYCGSFFTNCIFTNNHALQSDGGAVYNSGYQGTSSPTMTDCLFQNNNSKEAGGGIFSNGVEGVSSPTIANCRFVGNIADTYGGAMYNHGKGNLLSQVPGNASPVITNCLFQNNMAISAGAIYNLGADLGNANALITNSTFYGNHSTIAGGAIYCNAGELGTGTSSPTIRNCIFWGNYSDNLGDIFRIISGTPTISHSLVDKPNCAALYNGNGGFLNCGEGMVYDQDPQFASPASGNFHLLANSPCIDDGNNAAVGETGISMDLDHLPRIYNGTVDFGVYEFGSMAGLGPFVTQHPAAQTVCEGEMVTFSVSATGGQPLGFQWFKNGNEIAGANGDVLEIPSADLADAGNYACQVTNGTGESVLSEAAVLTVSQPAVVVLAIFASQIDICQGEPITLTAEVENGGVFPVFQWYLNGNAFGANIPGFTIDDLSDGDVFTCTVASSADCITSPNASSNAVQVNVENSLVAALTIAAEMVLPCEGQSASFTADPVNGGNSPSYAWSVNGSPAGDNLPSFTYIPQTGDLVACEMTSSKTCVVENPVNSNVLTIETQPVLDASVVVTPSVDSTVCLGDEVVFTAAFENGGSDAGFAWLVNGQPVTGNGPTFATTELNNLDAVFCQMASSLACVAMNPVASNIVTVSVDSCAVPTFEGNGQSPTVLVYPNPTNGRIFVQMMGSTGNFTARLLNTYGQLLLSPELVNPVATHTQALDLTHLPKGVYYLQIMTDGHLIVERLVVD